MQNSSRFLEVGCGSKKAEGAIGMDVFPYPGVDVVHNIDECPWPFEESHFEKVYARHVIEHVNSIADFFREIHRISRPGAEVLIETPHFTSLDSYADPTHRWHLSTNFAEVVTKGGYLAEQTGEFEIVHLHLSFGSLLKSWRARLIVAILGLNYWERNHSFRFRARNIYLVLRVIK